MENKQPFYETILKDVTLFDKIIYDLEKMSEEAPNPRIRTVSDVAIANIKLAQEICKALHDAKNA